MNKSEFTSDEIREMLSKASQSIESQPKWAIISICHVLDLIQFGFSRNQGATVVAMTEKTVPGRKSKKRDALVFETLVARAKEFHSQALELLSQS